MILAAVLGDPISHSRSPALHGHWLRHHGIDGAYVPLRVTAVVLPDLLRMMPGLGFAGCNVTIPHKEAALALADTATDRARRIGAANTLVFADGVIHADNTDGYGFLANLAAGARWDPARPVLILGAGGAARAVIDALSRAGARDVRVANRTRARADALAHAFPGTRAVEWGPDLQGLGLLVNTTALGMVGQPSLDIDLSELPGDAVVTDIVYTPLETDLLAAARARGNPVVDGLGMLLHQAVPGFRAWFGVEPRVDGALRDAVLE
ncbi:shikimate dehydrogenase [Jannaschia sp. LMIT008]|uniref:shikimate dehydrogenase n=1 Tax=Jannaschia maritima TaxID=3032585 RepID=UPI002811E8CE|nr:shikimate dehydrogenase [Jannaschia sp. LMIT008]